MKRFLRWIEGSVFMGPTETGESLTDPDRYQRFRRTLLAVMLFSLIPLLLVSGISYYHYIKLYQQEEQNVLLWSTTSIKNTIETSLNDLVSTMTYVAKEHPCEEISDQSTLNSIYARLQELFPGIVDLSVIDTDGIQQTYAGPEDLKGKDYSKQPWFNRAVSRPVSVSSVFLGHRNEPHFVVTVSNLVLSGKGCWMFKASINTETLAGWLDNKAADDIFLVDTSGILQTSSRFYGKMLSEYPLAIPPDLGKVSLSVDKKTLEPSLQASTYIKGTPWVLILIKRGYASSEKWSLFEYQLVTLLVLSLILGLLIIFRIVNFLVYRIHDSDYRREAILDEVEHTSKLASIGRLSAGVAHEINNPLAVINEKAGLVMDLLELSDDFPIKEKLMNQMDGILFNVNRGKKITQQLLGFARRMDVSQQPENINDILMEVLSFLDKKSLYRGIELKTKLSAGLPKIKSDSGQLQQIFLNIINNAIDAVGENGKVEVATLLRDKNTLQIDIADNGSGILPENIEKIFEPFFTTKTTGEKKGTGLGLSITYGLVKKLGGDIKVKSTVDVGTTFTVLLPIK